MYRNQKSTGKLSINSSKNKKKLLKREKTNIFLLQQYWFASRNTAKLLIQVNFYLNLV